MRRILKDFSRLEVSSIAKEYSSTNLECSHMFFEGKYEISQTTFYNLLNKAILISAVDDKTAAEIASKAQHNAFAKAGHAAEIRSRKKFYYLMKKRKAYLPSNSEMIFWAKSYSESALDKASFAKYNCIDPKLLGKILCHVIINQKISRKVFEKLKSKSLLMHGFAPYVILFWERMENEYTTQKGTG